MLSRLVSYLLLLFITLPIQAQSDWETLAPMSVPRSETGAVLHDDMIYVVGGLARGNFGNWVITDFVEAYDIEADMWTTLSPIPVALHHPIVTAHNGILYVFGGSDNAQFRPVNSAYAYDISSDTWTELANLPRAMMSTQAVVIENTIYIAGGDGGQRILAYDIEENSWQSWAASSLEHDHSAVVLMDEQIYVLGGRNAFVEDYSAVEIYDPIEDSWVSGTSMLEARAGFGAVYIDESIIAFGGELLANNQNDVLQTSEIYDFETDTWMPFIDLPVPLHGMPVLTDGSRIYLIGGLNEDGLQDTVWALNLELDN